MSNAMNHCEQLKETLVAGGRGAVEQNPDLAAHAQDCAECRRLLQAWAQIPRLLAQLPEYEPDAERVHAVSEAIAGPGVRGKSENRSGYLAPPSSPKAASIFCWRIS